MAAKEPTVERRHREEAIELSGGPGPCCRKLAADGKFEASLHQRPAAIAQAIADAEQRGYERGLADRDERCLQSDMQRIRERLAAEKAWDEGYASGGPTLRATNPYRLPKGPTK